MKSHTKDDWFLDRNRWFLPGRERTRQKSFFLREASISFANRLQKYVRNVMKKHKHTQKYYAILTIEYIIRIKR